MNYKIFFISIVLTISLVSCTSKKTHIIEVSSPDKTIQLNFIQNQKGELSYTVFYNNEAVIDTSYLSFDLKNQPSLKEGFEIVKSNLSSMDEIWQMQWGEQIDVKNNYNQLV
ncbi:MAG: glycoside hydrolase family 97 N-terminal domain-containing protein, partial [Flavobacteriaceae bacterium]|nr:glycoside hydrolase family 97 N-terminal domain-containing protein [Flavobacteriaceae bacterium]